MLTQCAKSEQAISHLEVSGGVQSGKVGMNFALPAIGMSQSMAWKPC